MGTTEKGSPPRARAQRWQPAPVATPGEVNFAHPKLREYLGNLLNEAGGPFTHVDGDARKLIKELLHCRNPDTGKCFPSWEYLARASGDSPRNVGYMLGRLDSGPSRQSDGRIVDGHGLIWRRSDRCGFRRLPTQYGITCRFLILAGLVLPHNCMECRCGLAWGAEERGSIFSGSSDHALHLKSSQNKGELRTRARSLFVKSSPPAAPDKDPTLTGFLAMFERLRLAKYSDNEHGSVSSENRDKLSAFLADLVGGAWAWAVQEGFEGTRAEVAEALFERLARLWLDWPGTARFLCERRHPIGLLIGDLEKFGKLARASWKRALRKPKPLEAHEAPAGAVTAAEYVEQLQAQAEAAEAALPELDAAEIVERAAREQGAAYIALAHAASAALLPSALAPGAPVVRLFPEPAFACAIEHEDAGDDGYVDNDTGDDRDFFPRELERARQEVLFRVELEADALPPTLGPVELDIDAREAGLRGLDLAGEQEQRSDGIGDDHARGANGGEDSIEDKIGASDDVSPGLGGGGGAADGGIEGSDPRLGEADGDVMGRDGATVGLPGASHAGKVPRSAEVLVAGAKGVSRKDLAGGGESSSRDTPTRAPSPRSAPRARPKNRENGPKEAGISVSREPVSGWAVQATNPTAADVDEPPSAAPLVLAPVLRAVPARAPSDEGGKLAASKAAHARALLAALLPPPNPERRTAAAAPVLEDEPMLTPAPTTTEKRPGNDRGGTEANTDPAPGLEALQETPEGPRPPRVRRPGSRPFAGTTGVPGRRHDAWRSLALPEAPADEDRTDE